MYVPRPWHPLTLSHVCSCDAEVTRETMLEAVPQDRHTNNNPYSATVLLPEGRIKSPPDMHVWNLYRIRLFEPNSFKNAKVTCNIPAYG